jgi:hypothetical protein
MTTPSSSVTLRTIRDATLRHLDSPREYALLRQRLATHGLVAYTMAVRDACADCPASFESDVADLVRAALKARAPRMIRRARRVA